MFEISELLPDQDSGQRPVREPFDKNVSERRMEIDPVTRNKRGLQTTAESATSRVPADR